MSGQVQDEAKMLGEALAIVKLQFAQMRRLLVSSFVQLSLSLLSLPVYHYNLSFTLGG